MFEIYLHRNRVNGKVYVGLTDKGMLARWAGHLKRAQQEARRGCNVYFHNALMKYGPDVWDHEVLETADITRAEAAVLESKWISRYRSNDKEKGYNSTPGGNVSEGPMQESVRRKISASVKKLMTDPERRRKHSEMMKARAKIHANPFLGKSHEDKAKVVMAAKSKAYQDIHGNPFAGKTHDAKTRQRMSEAAKKRCADPNWKAPSQVNGVSVETRKKMSEARKGKHTGKISKEMLLESCRGCTTQKQLAERLGCTAANVSYLVKIFEVSSELRKVMKKL